MSIKLEELKKREPIDTHLPLPSSHPFVERYRRVQHELEKRNLRSLHSFSRERLDRLLDELEDLLNKTA